MRILAVSDEVDRRLYTSNIKQKLPHIDLIVSCGDLPFYYLDFLVSSLNVPMLYVLGNHDPEIKKRKFIRQMGFKTDPSKNYNSPENFGGQNIDGKVVNIQQTLFAGLEGCMWYNGGPHQYTEKQMRNKFIKKLGAKFIYNSIKYGRAVDVFVSHAPPLGIHDAKDLPHKGFRVFRTIIERFKPKFFLHGHIHLYDLNSERVTKVGDTIVINCFGHHIIDTDADWEEVLNG